MPPRRDLEKEAKLERYLRRAVEKPALRKVAGLFLESHEPGYNPDAAVPWKDATVQTRAALLIAQGVMAAQRSKTDGGQTTNVFGMVMMQPRIESPTEWEAFAKQVHAESQVKAIDAVVVQDDSDKPEDQ